MSYQFCKTSHFWVSISDTRYSGNCLKSNCTKICARELHNFLVSFFFHAFGFPRAWRSPLIRAIKTIAPELMIRWVSRRDTGDESHESLTTRIASPAREFANHVCSVNGRPKVASVSRIHARITVSTYHTRNVLIIAWRIRSAFESEKKKKKERKRMTISMNFFDAKHIEYSDNERKQIVALRRSIFSFHFFQLQAHLFFRAKCFSSSDKPYWLDGHTTRYIFAIWTLC